MPNILMKKLALLLCFCFSNAHSARNYINYLAKITNNSSRAFYIYCYNFKWEPMLFVSPTELERASYSPDAPQSSGEILMAERTKLMQEKADLVNELTTNNLQTDEQIAQNPRIQAYDQKIADLTKKLRPVIGPNSTLDNVSCRLFSNEDMPTEKPKGWQLPQTYVEQGGIKLEIIDTNKQDNCPQGFIKIEARSKNQTSSTCIDSSQGMGKVHLIINKDGSFRLEAITAVIPTE